MKRLVLILSVFLALSRPAHAWIEHHHLTRTALQAVPALKDKTVTITDFSEMAKALGYSNPVDFNAAIQIHKSYRFDFKNGEKVGQKMSLIEAVARYSDEPDWGMDRNLYGPDQYPELWSPELAYMGGKTGLGSQSSRHMYWPGFSWAHPIRTFKIPPKPFFAAWGNAPLRSQVFADLAKRAQKAGHPYWAARFLGNALHYLEDVAQPFHAAQVPTKKYLIMPLTWKNGGGFDQYVKQVTQLVTFYHLAFEDYIGYAMNDQVAGKNRVSGRAFFDAIAGKRGAPLIPQEGTPADRVRAMADFSSQESAEAGRTSMEAFPELPGNYATVDLFKFLDEPWIRKDLPASPSSETLYAVVLTMFNEVGHAVRSMVAAEGYGGSSQ